MTCFGKPVKEWVYWTHTCTVVEGCTPVSAGCDHCWAAGMAYRFKRDFSKITVHPDRLERVVRGKPGKVISVWNDLYHEELSMDQHNKILRIIDVNQQHTFLALTKRPSFIMPVLQEDGTHLPYPPNLWLGTTAENQEWADKQIPRLLRCGSPNLFLSLEPLLGPIDFKKISLDVMEQARAKTIGDNHFVIVGCETGPKRRPCDPKWIRSIVRQCKQGGVPCFVKAIQDERGEVVKRWNDSRFPDDLKVREFPIESEKKGE